MTVVIGTAGHIDHGKTTLLRALTGIDADRLPEERRRGMTIDVGYAHLVLAGGEALDFVDVPGHDRLVGNMLVGAGEIDAALLVVAADDGPRAQTVEHLALLDALGIRDGLASGDQDGRGAGPSGLPTSSRRSSGMLEGTSLAGSPVVAASSGHGRRDRGAAGRARGARRAGRLGRGFPAGGHDRVSPRDRPRLRGEGPWRGGDGNAPGPPADPRRDPPARSGRTDRPGPRGPGPQRRRSRRPGPVGLRSTWPASRPATSTAVSC